VSMLNRLINTLRGENELDAAPGCPEPSFGTNGSKGSTQPDRLFDLGRVARINDFFLQFGDDPSQNIQHIVDLCGELLQADCMFYYRLADDLLVTTHSWQALPDDCGSDVARGSLCFDVIRQANDSLAETGRDPERCFVVRSLPTTPYYETDPSVRRYGLQTFVGRPVRADSQAVGALCATFKRDYLLLPQDEYLLGIMAAALGVEERRRIAEEALHLTQQDLEHKVVERTTELQDTQTRLEAEIHNHRQTEQALQRVTHQQEWLIQASRHLTEMLDLREVLARIGEGARHILAGDACAIYLLELDGHTLSPVLAMDEPYQDQVMATPLDVDSSLTGQAVKTRQAMVFNEISLDQGAKHIPGTPLESDERLIAAPFIFGEDILGVMTHNRVGEPFSPEELALARTFADYAAVALHNAHLFGEMQNALDALQRSEVRYRDLFENAASAIYVHDLDGNILDANPMAVERMGYTLEELLAKNLHDFIAPASAALLPERLGRLREDQAQSFESVHYTRQGQPIPVQVNARLVQREGQPVVVSFVQDISERKAHDAEREAILQISQALRLASKRDEMFPILAEEVVSILSACCVQIYQQPPGGSLVNVYSAGLEALPWVREPHWLEPDLQRALKSQSLISRVFTPEPESEMSYVLLMPLVAQQGAFGVLVVGRHTPYTQLEQGVLENVGDVAANALHRAELHEETRRQLRRLEALHTIERAITSIMNLDTLLKIVMEHVVELLNVDAADILLYEMPTLGLQYAAGQGFKSNTQDPSSLRQVAGLARQAVLEQRLVYLPDLSQHYSPSLALTEWIKEEGFVSYLGVPLTARGQVVGVLELFHRQRLGPDQEWLNFMDTLARQTAIAIDNTTLVEDLQRTNLDLTLAYDKTLEGWAKALELKDKETEGHSRNVTDWTLRLARRMGMPEEHLVHVRRGTLLHDIGKMGIPDAILQKPGPLDEKEWQMMRLHPVYAHELLSPIPFLRSALEIPYCHHERWDGSGYPRQLRGEQIPLAARIFSVVDVWDALRTDRPYRKAWPEAQVRIHLRELSGVLFDPQVVHAFLELLDESGGD
jgi:PAS domain S-box-containing protein